MLARNSALRSAAMDSLTGKWGIAAVSTLVYVLIAGAGGIIPMAGTLITILVCIPLGFGYTVLFLKSFRGEEIEVGKLFDGFHDYGRVLGTMLLAAVYTFLWMLLLVVPGIIKAYSYAMTAYVVNDNPELSFNAAIDKSMAMMKGRKMKLFLLDLSFIGWGILCLFTFGIGIFWLQPYVASARAAFYEDLKKETSEIN